MSEVKVFRIKGTLIQQNHATPFVKELRSSTSEAALERVYADFGSQHKVKRVHIKVESIAEIKPEDAKNPLVRQLSGE